MTIRVYGANGGWAAIRSITYNGTGHIYDEPYHQVTPIVSNGEWSKMISWCVETYGVCSHEKGPGVWTPSQRWYANNSRFWFKDKKDCEWFLLRWQ